MKPGYKSTEFWVTVGIQLAGMLTLFGVIGPEETKMLNSDIPAMGALVQGIAADVAALGAMVITAFRYITGRSAVKKAEVSK